jgi:hypothetical protein
LTPCREGDGQMLRAIGCTVLVLALIGLLVLVGFFKLIF